VSDRPVPWTEDDAGARAKFAQGHAWQRLPFEYLRAHGFAVDMPALEVRTNYADRHRFKNQADLFVQGRRVEVKAIPARFTGPHDWPFGAVFVDEVKKFDSKDPKPVAYIMVSQETGGMVCLKADPRHFEIRRGVRDKVRGTVIAVYTVPTHRLRTLDVLVAYFTRVGGHDTPAPKRPATVYPADYELQVTDIRW
jgi:hypothetical protein